MLMAGLQIASGEEKALNHGDRIIIGKNHYFRLNIPQERRQVRGQRAPIVASLLMAGQAWAPTFPTSARPASATTRTHTRSS
jgi:hypothetical protein